MPQGAVVEALNTMRALLGDAGFGSYKEGEGSQVVDAGVSITSSNEALVAYGLNPQGRYKLILGYAGWGPGQLDDEIKQGAWLTAQCTSELIFDVEPEEIWPAAVRSVGVDPASLVQAGNQLN